MVKELVAVKDMEADRYRNNGDGTVADSKTGLIWQRYSVGQNNDATCSGEAKSLDWNNAKSACEGLADYEALEAGGFFTGACRP